MSEQIQPEGTPQGKLENIVNVPCDNCGSEMVYDPGNEGLLCNHCGHTRSIPKASDMVEERSYRDALNMSTQPTGYGVETKVFHCNNCGAETAVDPDQVAFDCPFCGSTNVNAEAHDAKVITPSGVLPFKVTRKQANEKFNEWLGQGFFAPGNLTAIAKLDKLHGVYLPFWTYDAFCQSHWTAMAGYHYYETEYYTDSDGNQQSKQVRKTRWVPTSGYFEHSFDDVLVLGSQGLKQKFTEKIFPFDLNEVVNYDSRYILGMESEVYQKDVKEGFDVAEGIMDGMIKSMIQKEIPGDTHKQLRIRTHKDDITFKHVLLPIWIAAYDYNGKIYRFLVNGQTGKISGKKPVSTGKIIALIVFIVAIITTIVLL
ncbi:MAG: hypothetical protein AAF570_03875, partial [Bacteroidota bacterium]